MHTEYGDHVTGKFQYFNFSFADQFHYYPLISASKFLDEWAELKMKFVQNAA